MSFHSLRIPFLFVAFIVCLRAGALAQQAPSPAEPKANTSDSSDSASPATQDIKPGGAPPSVDGSILDPKAKFPEDWGELKVKDVPPEALPGDDEVLVTADLPDFTRDLVQAHWRSNDPIDLYIMRPKGIKKPPVILYLYSYATKAAEPYKNFEYGKLLTQYGFAAVGFESALTGDRYHDVPQRKWFVSELQRSLGTTVHDVQLILDYLEKRGDVDMSRVGMFGDGSGATIAILAAAADPRIKVVDLLNPWGDWPDWMAQSAMLAGENRTDYLKPEFLKSVENLDPVKWLPELKNRKVRLQYIRKGVAVTPPAAMARVEAAAPPNVKIVHYENKQEFLTNVAFKGTGLDWIKEQLGAHLVPPAETTTAAQPSPAAKTP